MRDNQFIDVTDVCKGYYPPGNTSIGILLSKQQDFGQMDPEIGLLRILAFTRILDQRP